MDKDYYEANVELADAMEKKGIADDLAKMREYVLSGDKLGVDQQMLKIKHEQTEESFSEDLLRVKALKAKISRDKSRGIYLYTALPEAEEPQGEQSFLLSTDDAQKADFPDI